MESAKPKIQRGPPRAKAPTCLTSSVPRVPVQKRAITQLLMTADQILQACTLSEPKVYNGTTCHFLNGPQGQQVFLHLPCELLVGFINDCKFDPTKKEVGFSKTASPENWAALEQLDALGRQFWNHLTDTTGLPTEYRATLQADWWILLVPNEWLVGVSACNDPDPMKRSNINLDIRIKGLYTRATQVLKRYANGEPMFARNEPPAGSPIGAKGKYPDEAFEMRRVSSWSFSIERYQGPIPQFFDDHGDQQSEEYTPVNV